MTPHGPVMAYLARGTWRSINS